MGNVMIRCPLTGVAIATGLTADSSEFARTPVFMARAACPACRSEHEWFAREAWVEEPREERRAASGSLRFQPA